MEQWKVITGHTNYEVSNTAKVRRIERKIPQTLVTEKELSQRLNNDGYPVVRITVDGIRKWRMVHRLLAVEFISNNDSSKTQIDHIDGNKENNSISNLEWVTPKTNTRRAHDMGLCEFHKNRKRLNGRFIKE